MINHRRKGWTNGQVFLICSLSCIFCLNLSPLQSSQLLGCQCDLGGDIGSLLPSLKIPAPSVEKVDQRSILKVQGIIQDIALSDPTLQRVLENHQATQTELIDAIYETFSHAVESKFGVSCTQPQPQPQLKAQPIQETPSINQTTNDADQPSYRFSPKNTKHLSGIARVKREEFLTQHDGGLPVDIGRDFKNVDVWVLYGAQRTLPTDPLAAKEASQFTTGSTGAPILSVDSALENCEQMNVLHVRLDRTAAECTALVPDLIQSNLVQKWLRLNDRDPLATLDMKMPFRLVPRLRSSPILPPDSVALETNQRQRNFLGEFLSDVDGIIEELKPIVTPIARNNQIVITFVNVGHFDFLVNFVCVAKARGLPIGNILVFVGSPELKVMVEDLGLAAYHNSKYMGKLPDGANGFGAKHFGKLAVMKHISAYFISCMGYNFLFQDVDIVWYRDPLTFLEDPSKADPSFDIYFQDDNFNNLEQMPFRGNSGSYYVRNNAKTQKLFLDAVVMSDRVGRFQSDQRALATYLFQNAASEGLKVKTYHVLDTEYFLGGYHFHSRKYFMKRMFEGESETYLFHMNWAQGHDVKVNSLKQMESWHVHDQCVDKTLNELQEVEDIKSCCSVQPLFSCHYSDKPSTRPCPSSPKLYPESTREFWTKGETAKFYEENPQLKELEA